MIRLLIADDEKLEREALADMVSRRFEHEVVLELAENGRKAADTAVLWTRPGPFWPSGPPAGSSLSRPTACSSTPTRPCIWEPAITSSSLWIPTSWKPPSGGPCGRSRRSESWKNWPERPSCPRSRKRLESRKTRKKTLRRQSPLRAKTARPLWS